MDQSGYTAARLVDASNLEGERTDIQSEQEPPPADDDPAPTICGMYAAGKFVIDPQCNNVLPFWDIIIMLLCIVVSLRVPYVLGFTFLLEMESERKEVCHADSIVNILFVFDIFLQFTISSPDPVNHRWIKLPCAIVKQYLSLFFLSDVFSVLPYGRIAKFAHKKLGPRYNVLGDGMGILKVLELLKLTRVNRIIQRYDSRVGMPYAITKLAKLLGMLALSLHWIACSWGLLLSVQTMFGLDEMGTWSDALRTAKPAMFAHPHREEPFELYTASLYWSCMTITSIGYGDITATNKLEAWGAIIMMGACGIIWANIIGSICAIASSLDADNIAHENQMDSLNLMLYNFELPNFERMRIREFFQRRKVLNNKNRHVELLQCMSPDLQGTVARWVQSTLLQNVSVFRQVLDNDAIIVGLFETFQYVMYPPKELVVKPGCFVTLRSGVALLTAQVLQPGSFWGVADIILSNPLLWENSKTLALSYLELQFLERDSFHSLIVKYPEEYRSVRKAAVWLAMKTAVLRGIISPTWDEEQSSQSSRGPGMLGDRGAICPDSRRRASGTNAAGVKVGKAGRKPAPAEAKARAALDLAKHGDTRQLEATLDDLVQTLSSNFAAGMRSEAHERHKL